MDSLRQLNTYSNRGVPYSDQRPMSIAFSPDPPVDQTLTVSLANLASFTNRTGSNITSLISGNAVSYSVNVNAIVGGTVTWPTPLPTLVTATQSGNVYTVSNIAGVTPWQELRWPTITVPAHQRQNINFANNFVIPSTISYGGNTRSWTTTVTVTGGPTQYYTSNTITRLFSTSPTITAAGPDTDTYTVELILGSNIGFMANATGLFAPSTEWNYASRTYTISGNLSTVNAAMANVWMYPHRAETSTTTLTYKESRNGQVTKNNQVSFVGNTGAVLANLGVYTFNGNSALTHYKSRMVSPWLANTGSLTTTTYNDYYAGDVAFGSSTNGIKEPNNVRGSWTSGTRVVTLTNSNSTMPFSANTADSSYPTYPILHNNNKFVNGDLIKLGNTIYTVANTTPYNSNTVYVTRTITDASSTNVTIPVGLAAEVISTVATLSHREAFYLRANILVVGGGGSGGGRYSAAIIPPGSPTAGGGGGGGAVVYQSEQTLSSYWNGSNVQIQAHAGAGGDSYNFAYGDGGPLGGQYTLRGHRGGASNVFLGSTTITAYGGGAGASNVDAATTGGTAAGAGGSAGADGSPSLGSQASDITGTMTYYGLGGTNTANTSPGAGGTWSTTIDSIVNGRAGRVVIKLY